MDENERAAQRRRTDGGTGNPYTGIGARNAETMRTMGNAQSTTAGNKSALKLFEHFLQTSSYQENSTLDEVVNEFNSINDDADAEPETVKGEELVRLFIEYAGFLSGNVYSLPPRNDLLLAVSTKVQYFSSFKEMMKAKMPDLPIWRDHDGGNDSGWYSCLRSKVLKKAGRTFFQNEEDDADPSPKCRALVIRSSTEKVRQAQRIWLEMNGCDLENIVLNLLKSTDLNKFELRAMLVMLYYAAGRGGELKFLHWGLVTWDYHFTCPQAWWTRMKTVVKQLLMFQCYHDGYLCDFYHAMGSFFATGGLIRDEHVAANRARNKRVFPSLYPKTDKSIAQKITDLVKKYCHPTLKANTSSRSLRVGAITELKVNNHISDPEAGYAAGFSAKDNSGIYLRPPPSLGIASANALCNWPTPSRHNVLPPSLDALAIHLSNMPNLAARLDHLMARIFVSSLAEFRPNGSLYELTKTCFATLLMHHKQMNKDCGRTNKVSVKIIDAFKAEFDTHDEIVAERIVIRWGKWILDKHEQDNNRSICIANQGIDPNYMVHMRAQTAMLQNILSAIGDHRVQTNETTNLILSETRRRQLNTANNDDARNTAQPQLQEQQQQNEDGNAATQQIVQNTRDNMRANMTATDLLTGDAFVPACANGNYPVEDLLVKQVTEGTLLKAGEDGNRSELMSQIWNAPYPPEAVDSRSSGKYKACMKIVHLIMDADDRQFIKEMSIALSNQGNHDGNQLVDFHARIKKIVADSFDKMHSFDDVNARTFTITALGTRAEKFFKKDEGKAIDPAAAQTNQRTMNSFFERPV